MPEKSFNKISFSTGQVYRSYSEEDSKFYDDKGVPLPNETLASVSAGEAVTLSVGDVPQTCTYTISLEDRPELPLTRNSRLEADIGDTGDSFSHLY